MLRPRSGRAQDMRASAWAHGHKEPRERTWSTMTSCSSVRAVASWCRALWRSRPAQRCKPGAGASRAGGWAGGREGGREGGTDLALAARPGSESATVRAVSNLDVRWSAMAAVDEERKAAALSKREEDGEDEHEDEDEDGEEEHEEENGAPKEEKDTHERGED